jgi:hypothetical protein
MLQKIISGGQTGADRAALDAAQANHFPCGGFCPQNRRAEDGPIDQSYPLTEIEGGYAERTEQNVIHSDGTVIFYVTSATGGSRLTNEWCIQHQKPLLKIDISNIPAHKASSLISKFVDTHKIELLNIAGPRASECQQIYKYVKPLISELLNCRSGLNSR